MFYKKGYTVTTNTPNTTRRSTVSLLIKAAFELTPLGSLGRLLPFQTRVIGGDNFNHIQSLSAFDIDTERRVIEEGDTLCGRKSSAYHVGGVNDRDCPGCTAIGQGLATRELEKS